MLLLLRVLSLYGQDLVITLPAHPGLCQLTYEAPGSKSYWIDKLTKFSPFGFSRPDVTGIHFLHVGAFPSPPLQVLPSCRQLPTTLSALSFQVMELSNRLLLLYFHAARW